MKTCKTIGCFAPLYDNSFGDFCSKCMGRKASNDETGFEVIEGIENPVTAADILQAGIAHMEDRARTYDSDGGERSMRKTVAAFNLITGHSLTETEGWKFMELLKMVRSCQGDFHQDSYEDRAAYAALAAEAHAKEQALECVS